MISQHLSTTYSGACCRAAGLSCVPDGPDSQCVYMSLCCCTCAYWQSPAPWEEVSPILHLTSILSAGNGHWWPTAVSPVLLSARAEHHLCHRPGFLLLRGACSFVSVSALFWSVTLLPLADALVLQFLSPLMIAVMAPLLIQEKPSRYCAGVTGPQVSRGSSCSSCDEGHVPAHSEHKSGHDRAAATWLLHL